MNPFREKFYQLLDSIVAFKSATREDSVYSETREGYLYGVLDVARVLDVCPICAQTIIHDVLLFVEIDTPLGQSVTIAVCDIVAVCTLIASMPSPVTTALLGFFNTEDSDKPKELWEMLG